MKIKDQIRTRRDQLGVTIEELGRRVGVSHQSIRHWECGRSYPAKKRVAKLEDALSFRLDWTEGVRNRSERPDVTALLDQEDIEVMLVIRKLPSIVKRHMAGLAQMYMDALDQRTPGFTHRESEGGTGSFAIRESGGGEKIISGHIKKSTPRKGGPAQKRAA